MMNLSTDDPRLTAYALGELDDPGERAAIEQALATRPELQAAVDEIRRTAELLQSGLAGEPAPEPSEFEKARMEQVPEPPSVGDRLSETWAVHKRAIIALAATVAFAAIIIPQMRIFKEQSAPISVSQGDVQSETPEGHMENIDASLKAVEGLDIRAAQQADRVEEILERLEALPKPGETAAASVPEQSERESEAIT